MPFTLIDFGVWCDAGIGFGVWCDAGDPMSLLPIETANGPDSVYGTVKPFLVIYTATSVVFQIQKRCGTVLGASFFSTVQYVSHRANIIQF